MRAGRLKHRLYLQQRTDTRDAHGGTIPSWSTTATVSGAVEALTGWENLTADQITNVLMVRIVIRYGDAWKTINTKWRVKDVNTGKKYNIQAVIQAEHRSRPNTMIELMCVESEQDDE